MKIFAFKVWFKNYEYNYQIINHITLNKARALLWYRSLDYIPSYLKFIDIRGHKIGPPQNTKELNQVQIYRKRPELIAGTKVQVKNCEHHGNGWIVDAGAGCNFCIQFENGARFYAHSLEIQVLQT